MNTSRLTRLIGVLWVFVTSSQALGVTEILRNSIHPEVTSPLSRLSEPKWKQRFEKISKDVQNHNPEIIFFGDSITHGWEFFPEWSRYFGSFKVLNAGISSDRVEHILWRIKNGNLANSRPKVVVLLAGINNIALKTAVEIKTGISAIIDEISTRSPTTKIILLGLFPSGKTAQDPRRAKIVKVNEELKDLSHKKSVTYFDFGRDFLEADGSISPSIMPDYLHLSTKGYRIWASALSPQLHKLIPDKK